MKINFLFFFLALMSFNARCQTTIAGGSVSGTWTLAGSPYHVSGSIMIPDGTTLTIDPGVTVVFHGTYKLLVLGRLLANGTATDTITFRPAASVSNWRGIRFDNTLSSNDTSRIRYVKISQSSATGAAPDDNGGAFYFNNFSKAVISNCLISDCYSAVNGGSVFCSGSSPVITNNTITHSHAVVSGGGICCLANSHPFISQNTISNCSAGNGGGIFCISGSNPNITYNSIVSDTASDNYGGGILCYNCSPVIEHNLISYNIAKEYGGGIHCTNNSTAVISNNTISYNTSILYGGAGIFYSTDSPGTAITNNVICNNKANTEGGAIYGSGNNNSIYNNVVANNRALRGGGFYFIGSTSKVTNNTIVNNSSGWGAGVYCVNSDPLFKNCILYGNKADTSGAQVYLYDEPSDPAFTYCDIKGSSAAFDCNGNFFTGTYANNLDTTPLFTLSSGGSGLAFDGIAADWSLSDPSGCINSGDPAATYPATDIAGNPRVTGGRIDIGAFESQGPAGINDLNADLLKIYPNPFETSAVVEFPQVVDGITLALYTVSGSKVWQTERFSGKSITIERDALPAGIYLLRISQGTSSLTTRRLVIMPVK
ncbi:MAG: hypothetical protein JWO09_1591 [Bacteroidetes bacterium]|nr:hypothetical protein [Bacteroidota bacterium]